MKRREFIGTIASSVILAPAFVRAGLSLPADDNFTTFDKIIAKAQKENWQQLPIGDLIGKTASELLGKPYRGGTLEINDTEKCVVNLDELDCVTFFETALGLARIIKLEKYTYDALVEQITFTRYREGKIDGYTSRLHYTSDWIYDNVQKHVVDDITKSLNGKAIQFNVSFMSRHPKYYKQLKHNPELVKRIRQIEKAINSRTYYYIPKKSVAVVEKDLQTGDIIAIVNTDKGLDYSHTGLIYKKNGIAHFMHASSIKKKVVIDRAISQYLAHSKKSNKGITVLRPLEPKNAR